MYRRIAGIDVHKRMLMVAVGMATFQMDEASGEAEPQETIQFEMRRFGTTTADIEHLAAWLQQRGVEEVVVESTAQYWKPVWLGLEPHFRLHLAQAWSNRAPKGKKTDFKDAQRLVRRHLAGELTLSFIPEPSQRQMRTVTRRRVQLVRDRVRVQNQVESLLEEGRIKLSSIITDLLGASGRRILGELANGETDPKRLAALGDARLKCTPEQLAEAVNGSMSEVQQRILKQHLAHVELLETQIQELDKLAAVTMREHESAIARLIEIPGIGLVAAKQIIAEAGPTAQTFATAAQFSAWIGLSPGRQESAGDNQSSRCPKGNMYLRRILCQAAQAAVRTKNCFFHQKFHRLLPRLGYQKALWAIARRLSVVIWIILHEGVRYEERGGATTPQAAKRRRQRLIKELREAGYTLELNRPDLEAVHG